MIYKDKISMIISIASEKQNFDKIQHDDKSLREK